MTMTPPSTALAAHLRRGAIVLLAGAAAGCGARADGVGAGQGQPVAARSAIEGLGGRRCEYLNDQAIPQALDDVTRPGTRGSMMLWGVGATPTDTIEMSVRYNADGGLGWVRPLRNTAPPGRAEELERVLTAGLSPRGRGDWGFRLRFVAGSFDAVLPSVVCRPEQSGAVPRMLPPTGTRQETAEAMRMRQGYFPVDLALDEHGRVVGVRLTYTTGSRLMDEHLLELARVMAFRPKLHDGVGVPSTTTIRFRFTRR